jgi:hypothetical protein
LPTRSLPPAEMAKLRGAADAVALKLRHHDEATHAAWCAAEVLRLRAVIEGRTTPPTPAEVEAHMAAGGYWLASIGANIQILSGRINLRATTHFTRWVAFGHDNRPCAWPEVAR